MNGSGKITTGTPELLYRVGEYDGLYISPDVYWTSWTRVENILQYLLSGQIDSLEERSRMARSISYIPSQQRGFIYTTLLKSGFMPATIDAYLPSTKRTTSYSLSYVVVPA